MSSAGEHAVQPAEEDTGRSYIKCDCCRLNHRRCFPKNRQWPGPRCTPCIEADLECGPSLHWKQSSLSVSSLERPGLKRARTKSSSSVDQAGGGSVLLTPASAVQPDPVLPETPRRQPGTSPWSLKNSFSSPTTALSSSFGTSTDFNAGDGQNLLRSQVGKQPGNPESTQNALESKLLNPGLICFLCENFKGLEAAFSPPPNNEVGSLFRASIKSLSLYTAYRARHALQTIVDLIEVEARSSQIQALQYREVLDEVDDINKLGPRSKMLVQLEETILSKLIQFYQQQGNVATVNRYSIRRSNLREKSPSTANADHIAHSAKWYSDACNTLPALMESLDLHLDIPNEVIGKPLFPALQSALRCGHDQVARFLSRSDGALNQPDVLKQDGVMSAAALGKLPLLNNQIQFESNKLKSRDLFGRTALYYTASHGTLDTFESLVKAGASITDRDLASQSILGAACAAGNLPTVRWLLEKTGGGQSPNDDPLNRRSPLHEAARGGHKDVCLLLLENGAFVDYLVDDGITPAETARTSGFEQLAEFLEDAVAGSVYNHLPTPQLYGTQRQLQRHVAGPCESERGNPFACPPPLPYEQGSAEFPDGLSGAFSNPQSSTFGSSLLGSSSKPGRLNADNSTDIYNFGNRLDS